MTTTPVISLMGARLRAPVLSPVLESSLRNRANFEAALEECVSRMMNKARGQSGRLSLEVIFGRIVVENVDEKAVNFAGNNAAFSCFEPIHLLREFQIFSEENIMFHPILSLFGVDGDRLARTHWTTKDPSRKWALHSTKVVYDFNCYEPRAGACFTLEVMADDFSHRFKSEQGKSLLDVVYVHCPNKAWDLSVHLRKTDELYYQAKYGGFARAITDSLTVPQGVPIGQPRFRFKENSKHNVTIEQIRVRHVARYVDGESGGSFLDITMWQDTTMSAKVPADSTAGERYVEVAPSQNDEQRGVPNIWYEASISSAGVEQVFKENAAMEFGDEAKWTVDQVRENGALKDLYLPALCMVGRMDRIGCHTNNGRDPLGEEVQSIVQSKLEKLKKETQADFW